MSADQPPVQRICVPFGYSGKRLDQVAHELFPDYSRARLQQWLKGGQLTVEGGEAKPKDKVRGGEWLTLSAEQEDQGEWVAEPIAFDVVFEDAHLIVVNKPLNLVVHPAAGHASGTLLNGLLYRWPELRQIPRCGIVHRLDKNTSGLMVIAKTLKCQAAMVEQLHARSVSRQYFALASGRCAPSGQVDAAIGRDPRNRKKMAVVTGGSGKPAITDFRTLCHINGVSCLRLKLHTGRTHQIRVHMAHLGHPLIGDQTYGRRLSKQVVEDPQLREVLQGFDRQALHAFYLALIHPETEALQHWQIDLPGDLCDLLKECDPDVSFDYAKALLSPWQPL